jgi:hypothetical protein
VAVSNTHRADAGTASIQPDTEVSSRPMQLAWRLDIAELEHSRPSNPAIGFHPTTYQLSVPDHLDQQAADRLRPVDI